MKPPPKNSKFHGDSHITNSPEAVGWVGGGESPHRGEASPQGGEDTCDDGRMGLKIERGRRMRGGGR